MVVAKSPRRCCGAGAMTSGGGSGRAWREKHGGSTMLVILRHPARGLVALAALSAGAVWTRRSHRCQRSKRADLEALRHAIERGLGSKLPGNPFFGHCLASDGCDPGGFRRPSALTCARKEEEAFAHIRRRPHATAVAWSSLACIVAAERDAAQPQPRPFCMRCLNEPREGERKQLYLDRPQPKFELPSEAAAMPRCSAQPGAGGCGQLQFKLRSWGAASKMQRVAALQIPLWGQPVPNLQPKSRDVARLARTN
ncbi:hypothetical protein L1887_48164 [Cichorium endivia]|nr:hypothetical protein L1887_48164 [Cichorium endivia]